MKYNSTTTEEGFVFTDTIHTKIQEQWSNEKFKKIIKFKPNSAII
jgi:hypothetical protein